MADNKPYSIYPFMIRDFNLKGAMLSVYAIIFGYWLSGNSTFASNTTLAERIGLVRETVNRQLRALITMDLITVLPGLTRYGCKLYTINETILSERAPDWPKDIPAKTLRRCDIMSHLSVTKNHTSRDEKSQLSAISCHTSCDEKSHDNISDYLEDNVKRRNIPLPSSLLNDVECCRLWGVLVASPSWAHRTPDMLAEAARVLDGHPVAVAREMIRHTIEGGYPRIYQPSSEVQARARQARCDEKSHLDTPLSISDDSIIGRVIALIPQDLRPYAYGTSLGPRQLRLTVHNGKVIVHCPIELRDWFEANQQEVECLARDWVGAAYLSIQTIYSNT